MRSGTRGFEYIKSTTHGGTGIDAVPLSILAGLSSDSMACVSAPTKPLAAPDMVPGQLVWGQVSQAR